MNDINEDLLFATGLVKTLLESQPELRKYPDYLNSIIRLTVLQARNLRELTNDVNIFIDEKQKEIRNKKQQSGSSPLMIPTTILAPVACKAGDEILKSPLKIGDVGANFLSKIELPTISIDNEWSF